MAKTMSVSEASKEYGLSPGLIYNAVARGELPGVSRLGNRIILNRERFEEFLEGTGGLKSAGSYRGHKRLVGKVFPTAAVEERTMRANKPTPRTRRMAPVSRTIPEFVITVIESFAAEGMSAREIWRRLGGKRTGEETIHDGQAFRMPSQWTINKYARVYKEKLLGYRMKPGHHIRKTKNTGTVLSGGHHDEHGVTPVKENTATVQQETNEVNRHRITIGNTFDCVNCGERFKKNYRLILTAMQGLKPKTDRKEEWPHTGDPRLTSYALCGASCLIEFTTKKEQEQWILTPLRSKKDLEPAETTGGGQRSFLRRLRDLAGGKD